MDPFTEFGVEFYRADYFDQKGHRSAAAQAAAAAD